MARREFLPFAVLVAFFVAFAVPLVVLLLVPAGVLSVQFEPQLLFSVQTRTILLTSLGIAAIAALIATPVLFVFAWLVARTDLPGRAAFDAIGILGLTFPDLLRAIGWFILLSPTIGLLNLPFLRVFGVPIVNVDTPYGLAFVLAWGMLPLEYLIVRASVRNVDPSMEEASRVSGASALRTFARVTIPSLTQAFLIIFALGFLIAFTDFDTAVILVPQGHYSVLAYDIYAQFLTPNPNVGAAATLGVLFLVVSLALFGVYLFLTRHASRFQIVKGAPRAVPRHLTGVRRWGAVAFCSVVMGFSFVLPLAGIVWLAFSAPGPPWPFTFAGLRNFSAVFAIPFVGSAWFTSLVLSVLVATACVPVAVVLAYAIFRSRIVGSRLLEYLVILPRGTPSIVYGLGVFLMIVVTPGLKELYGTIVPLFFAVVFLSIPVAVLIVGTNMVQISDELEEAARVGGRGWFGTFFRVIVPLNFRAIVSSAQYALIGTFSNVGSVVLILLATPSVYLLLPLLLNQLNSNAGLLNTIAAASVMVTAFLSLVVVSAKVVES